MAQFVGDRIVKIYQKVITQLRKDLGRDIKIYYQLGEPSAPSGEQYDPINKEVVNPNSSLVYNESVKIIHNVSVHFGPDTNPFVRLPGGALEPGDARLAMTLTDVLVDPLNLDGDTYFQHARKIVIDNVNYRVKSAVLKTGLRDRFNCRVIVERTDP